MKTGYGTLGLASLLISGWARHRVNSLEGSRQALR